MSNDGSLLDPTEVDITDSTKINAGISRGFLTTVMLLFATVLVETNFEASKTLISVAF